MKIKRNLIVSLVLVWFVLGPLIAQVQLTNIPTFYINTDDGQNPNSKDIYKPGRIIVKSSDPTEELDMITQIRGRGNSTWGAAKKPYRIKLDTKKHLLNNNANAKDWVLLANDFDRSLLRNAIALRVGELVGLTNTPSARFFDLVLNNSYVGNYLLTDQVEVHKNRVPVEEQEIGVTGLPAISGGYLIEVDGFRDGPGFGTNRGMPITIKYPKDDEINTAQFDYIRGFVQRFESTLFSSDFTDPLTGYRSLVDESSLINWYVACELTGNPDSFWSTYMYKYYNDDKFFFGPLWDFDIAFNNDGRLGDATRKLMREYAHDPKVWIKQIWRDDWFKKAVNDRWLELMNEDILTTLLNYIDELATLIDASQKLNENRWHKVNGSYAAQVSSLKSYLQARVAFLTESFASFVPLPPSQPFVADNFYYTIMNVRTNNVIEVKDFSLEPDSILYLMHLKDENYDSQYWTFEPIDESITSGKDFFQIFNKTSGLAIAGNGRGNNLIQVDPDLEDSTQMWKIVPVLTGNIYGLVNLKSGYSVNNSGGNSAEGTPVIEWDKRLDESENQQWYLKRMEEIPGDTVVIITTIDNIDRKNQIHLYPNPVSDKLYIRVSGDKVGFESDFSVKIYGIEGQCLYENRFNSHPAEIPISTINIRPGLYIVKITVNNTDFIEKLLVK
jgi:hypothetical protein